LESESQIISRKTSKKGLFGFFRYLKENVARILTMELTQKKAPQIYAEPFFVGLSGTQGGRGEEEGGTRHGTH